MRRRRRPDTSRSIQFKHRSRRFRRSRRDTEHGADLTRAPRVRKFSPSVPRIVRVSRFRKENESTVSKRRERLCEIRSREFFRSNNGFEQRARSVGPSLSRRRFDSRDEIASRLLFHRNDNVRRPIVELRADPLGSRDFSSATRCESIVRWRRSRISSRRRCVHPKRRRSIRKRRASRTESILR